MRLVHFSDWHWEFQQLPEADLYICSGDMFDNYPKRRERRGGPGTWYDRDGPDAWCIDPNHERVKQRAAAKHLFNNGGFGKYMGSPGAPIVCVRGNHDFIELAPLFEGLDVTEIVGNEVHEILGVKFTGHRGIPFIYGTWNDEVPVDQLQAYVNSMPPVDVFVTHYPPEGILDNGWNGHRGWGLEGMARTLQDKAKYDATSGFRALHCFGHIHEQGGQTVDHNGFIFSNAARGYNEIELTESGFKDVTRL